MEKLRKAGWWIVCRFDVNQIESRNIVLIGMKTTDIASALKRIDDDRVTTLRTGNPPALDHRICGVET